MDNHVGMGLSEGAHDSEPCQVVVHSWDVHESMGLPKSILSKTTLVTKYNSSKLPTFATGRLPSLGERYLLIWTLMGTALDSGRCV